MSDPDKATQMQLVMGKLLAAVQEVAPQTPCSQMEYMLVTIHEKYSKSRQKWVKETAPVGVASGLIAAINANCPQLGTPSKDMKGVALDRQYDDGTPIEGDTNNDGTVNEEDTPAPEQPSSKSMIGNLEEAHKRAIEEEEARQRAIEAVEAARNAASSGSRMLSDGQALEGVDGAKTGSSEDFALALQKVDDEMMALSDMNEMQQTRLQILMDRRAKLLETLSNVMKKMSQTKETLSANQK